MPTLEWIGKDKVINHHLDVPYRVLEYQYTYLGGVETSEEIPDGNKIIRGDNLEALKALLPQYEGKIKCIYIDPPYNTGNTTERGKWVYSDNVDHPQIKKWLGEVVGKEGEDLTRHDKWLCMMYPRLKLLHRLLSDDGSIFISINSIESANLRLICNEIFGINNFISEIACVNNPKGRSDDKYVATAHESILIYRKSVNVSLGGFEPEDKVIKRYNKTNIDGRKYRVIDLRKTGDEDLRKDRPDMFYPFYYNETTEHLVVASLEDVAPDGYIKILPMKSAKVEGRWRWGFQTAKDNIDRLIAKWMPKKKQWTVFEKDFLSKNEWVKPTSVWNFKNVNSERGTEMFSKYLGFSKEAFPNPKPVGTIERIIQIATDENSIVLDSFAGTGTTGQAVMQCNKNYGGNRRFILIEMEDYAEELTAERIRRVISGTENFNKIEGSFSFYVLGEPLLNADQTLNESVSTEKIRQYVFFMETKQPIGDASADEPYLLGLHANSAYYFYYEKERITTLNHEFLATVRTQAEGYVIYADLCMLSDEELREYHITFKKIPRDISRL
jgi:adenine-specific DNA-methyltransferase